MANRLPFREIKLLWQPPEVSAGEIEEIRDLYTKNMMDFRGIQLVINRKRPSSKKQLRIPDIYVILCKSKEAKKVTQRKIVHQELNLDDFREYFKIWKRGGTEKQCFAAILYHPDQAAAKSMFRNLGEFWRDTQREYAAAAESAVAGLVPGETGSVKERTLDLGVRCLIANEPCIVVFLKDVPLNWLQSIQAIPELHTRLDKNLKAGKDIQLVVADRLREEMELEKLRNPLNKIEMDTEEELFNTPSVPPEKKLTKAAVAIISEPELATLDPTGEVGKHGLEDAAIKGEAGRQWREARKQPDPQPIELPAVPLPAHGNLPGDNVGDEAAWEEFGKEPLDLEKYREAAAILGKSEAVGLGLHNLLDEDDPHAEDEAVKAQVMKEEAAWPPSVIQK